MSAQDHERGRLEALDDAHLWHPFTPMSVYRSESPLLVAAAEGHELIDTEGHRYLDAVSSLWCNYFGHRNKKIDEAIRSQLDRVAHSTLLGNANVPAIELAAKLSAMAPDQFSRVFFSDSGSTAVEVALKMAFQFQQQRDAKENRNRRGFMAINRAYHGDTMGSVALGGIAEIHDRFADLRFPILRAEAPHGSYSKAATEASDFRAESLERNLELLRRESDKLAALVVEPGFQGAAGILPWPKGYLAELCRSAQELGVLVIADEVASGLGRCGQLFSSEMEGLKPDFICLAKGLTGGYLPLAATLTTEQVYEAFLGRPEDGRTFFHGHTFTGNQLAASAALAALEILVDDGLINDIPAKVERLGMLLKPLSALPHVAEVRQVGLAVGIEIVASQTPLRHFPPRLRIGQRICQALQSEGVFSRPLGDVLVLMPALTYSMEELERVCAAYQRAIESVMVEFES